MSNLITKTCDHPNCDRIYAKDSNNWWWLYSFSDEPIVFGLFEQTITIEIKMAGNTDINQDYPAVLHYCGQEHLNSGLQLAIQKHVNLVKSVVIIKTENKDGKSKKEPQTLSNLPSKSDSNSNR